MVTAEYERLAGRLFSRMELEQDTIYAEDRSHDPASRRSSVLREHATFFWLVTGYVVATATFQLAGVVPFEFRVTAYLKALGATLPLFVVGSLVALSFRTIIVERPEKPIERILEAIRDARIRERIAIGIPVVLIMQVFASAFTFMKASILLVNSDTLDVSLAQLDRTIHGGTDPWILLQPVLGFPIVTSVINVLYQYWLILVVVIWFWQAFSLRDRRLRQQFFVAFVLCWILLGTIGAHLLPSVGPCFFGRYTGLPDDFAPLMDYLRTAGKTYPVWVTGSQDYLWGVYESNRLTIGAGISAMPSMHVAFAVLFAIVGWKTNRLLGSVLGAYALVILLGSVHLGWHYAIDGYFSIVGTVVIWWGVGLLQRSPSRLLVPPTRPGDDLASR